MTGGEVMALISLIGTLLLGVLAFVTNRRANRTSEKKLTLEEQTAEDDREDNIAERRRIELDRLYQRVDKLEKIVEQLRLRDEQKQTTINSQADELERTNELLSAVRILFSRFVGRVETAWKDGHTMPALTVDERFLLESTTPHRTKTIHPKE